MRQVSKLKLRANVGGGDAELRGGGQHVDKGDIGNWCVTLEPHGGLAVSAASQRVEKRGMSPK